MFKILLLQAWYRLSDPACEKQLVRDLLFRRFVGLSLQDAVPDHSTIWRFRNKLNEDGLILSEQLTPGNVHDSQVFEDLFTGHEKAVYADSAYKSDAQKQFNRYASQVRCTVERTFGVLKRLYGLGKARYLGLARNQARVSLIAMAHNLKRGANIQRAC